VAWALSWRERDRACINNHTWCLRSLNPHFNLQSPKSPAPFPDFPGRVQFSVLFLPILDIPRLCMLFFFELYCHWISENDSTVSLAFPVSTPWRVGVHRSLSKV